MKGRLKTIHDEIINTDLVSAKDFSRLYEAHLKALDKIESITKACHGHIDTIGRLQREAGAQYGEIQQLIIDNVELTEQNQQMKQALSDWQIHLEGN